MKALHAIAGAALLAAFVAGPSARAQEAMTDAEAPPKRYPPTSVRWKLVTGGLVVSGLAYGTGYLCASTWPDAPGASDLKIPIVGPWMALADSGCAKDDPDCGFTAYLRGFLTIIGGVLQAGGLGIAGEGIFMTTEAARPESKAARAAAAAAVTVRPVPVVTSRTTGIGVVGTF